MEVTIAHIEKYLEGVKKVINAGRYRVEINDNSNAVIGISLYV
ncbi:MAG: hypothetical protein PUC65_10690 [Clostridiales bacterium]|nr:hypothetical protein [Clostridiales bacterium]